MSEAETEQKIVAAGLNAPRLSPTALDAEIKSVEYVKHITHSGRVLRWCVINTHCGFSITGSPSATVSPENDNQAIGEEVAYQNARREMWPLLGYALRDRLHRGIIQ